jgi:hypothetical protein
MYAVVLVVLKLKVIDEAFEEGMTSGVQSLLIDPSDSILHLKIGAAEEVLAM